MESSVIHRHITMCKPSIFPNKICVHCLVPRTNIFVGWKILETKVNLLKRRGISYILTKSFWWISIYITFKTFFWAFMVISFYIPTVHKVVWNEVETSNLQNTNWLMVWCVSHQKEYGKKGRENIGPILKQASF